jgi:hypothetical protein
MDPPQDIFVMPVDVELQELIESSERRFPGGTSLDDLTISLEELQDLFFVQTLSPYWLSARLIKLCQVSYREAELLRSFNSRFSSAVINGKFDVNSTS